MRQTWICSLVVVSLGACAHRAPRPPIRLAAPAADARLACEAAGSAIAGSVAGPWAVTSGPVVATLGIDGLLTIDGADLPIPLGSGGTPAQQVALLVGAPVVAGVATVGAITGSADAHGRLIAFTVNGTAPMTCTVR